MINFIDSNILPAEVNEIMSDKDLLFEIDLVNTKNKKELLQLISKSFCFPDYFGHNWDALYDCLTDLCVIEKKKITLVFKNFNLFLRSNPCDSGNLIGILVDCAKFCKNEGCEIEYLFGV